VAQEITIVTGKTWTWSFQRKTKSGTPIPFIAGDSLRAQLRDVPSGKSFDVETVITSMSEGKFQLSLANDKSAVVPTAATFGIPRIYWLDVDILRVTGSVTALIANFRIPVYAGVTE